MSSYLTHLVGASALLGGVSSYLVKERKRMLLISTVSTAAWALYFLLRSDLTTSVLVMVSAIRIATGIYSIEWDARRRWTATIFFMTLSVLAAAYTWEGYSSLPSLAATLLLTYASLHLTLDKLRMAFLAGDSLWLLNAFIIGSGYGGVAAVMGLGVNLTYQLKQRLRRQEAAASLPL